MLRFMATEMEDVYDVLVDFGTVYCGSKSTRTVKIENKSTIDQIFAVVRYSDRPILDTGFSVNPTKSPPVKPNQVFAFTVEFVPNTVGIRSCDSFLIRHLYGVQCVLVTKAIVKGPECSLSCSQLNLVCPSDKKKLSKQFDLSNDGKCNAEFQFTVDEDHPLISVQPRHGSFSSSNPVHITVTYTPTNNQLYFKRIFCMVSNHEPLILDVNAVWLKSNETLKSKVERHDLPTYINGYHCFFYDVMNRMFKEEVPLVSLDKSYIDFGHCQPKKSKQIEFTVTNNWNHKLTVAWHQGIFTREFKIEPTEIEIEANNCARFLATFKPLVRDRLFGTTLEAQVYLCEDLVPVPVEVNLKGDSFEELSCGWAAQYRVEPASLVLPPCVSSPLCPSHATLTIHRRGHLPLAYSFHPPPLTNFCIKPQHGVIYGSFQIVIVQYQPATVYETIDTEKWLLTFNSNENVNQCTVELGCSIETPNVVINHGKELEFPPVHPGTRCTLALDIYNPTRFAFWFNLEVVGGDVVHVLTTVNAGELWPHEHRRFPMVFHPQGPGHLEARVSCSPVLEAQVAGRTTSAVIKASCLEAKLVAIPDKLSLKKVIRDFKHKRVIEVTNSGDSIIEGSFLWQPDGNCNVDELEVSFLPDSFYLKPGDSVNVEISITPFTIGEKDVVIRISASSPDDPPLLAVTVDCVYPTLQITDLRITNNAPLFTKMHYWKMMQINKLNTMLWNLSPRKTSELDMNLPSYVCISSPLIVELLIENDSELAASMSIRPLVSCNCQPVKKQVSFSMTKWDHNCPHRDQVKMEPDSVNIQGQSYGILKMKISFKTVGDVETHFLLKFTPEDYEDLGCSLKLRVSRTSIPKYISFVDTTEPKEGDDFVFNMRPVYIGDINPIAQGFLLYNNTKHYMNLEVDDNNLSGTPFKYIGEKNQIPATTSCHLLFTFLPYCCKMYEAEVIITINNKNQKLVLRGRGVSNPQEVNKDEEYLPRQDKLNEINPPEIFFSISHTKIGPVKPKTTSKSIFFINNISKDIISFAFLSTKLAELVQLRVTPSKGLIQPGDCVECHLKCHCSGWPSFLEVTLPCTYASFSQYAVTIQALARYYEDLVKSVNYFTITDDGKDNACVTPTPPTESWPVKNYLTIGVTVDVKDRSLIVDEDLLPICPSVVEPMYDATLDIGKDNKLLFIDVLERMLWTVIDDSTQARNDCLEVHYEQIKDLKMQIDVQVPDYVTQTVVEDVLHSTWQDVFQLCGYRSCELFRRHLIHQTTPDSIVLRLSSPGIPTAASISDSFMSTRSERFRCSSKKSGTSF